MALFASNSFEQVLVSSYSVVAFIMKATVLFFNLDNVVIAEWHYDCARAKCR